MKREREDIPNIPNKKNELNAGLKLITKSRIELIFVQNYRDVLKHFYKSDVQHASEKIKCDLFNPSR